MTKGLDWAGLMQAGLHGLRLMPDQFWRLTPAELALMLGQTTDRRPLGRGALEDLMRAFPDAPKREPET